MANNVSNLGLQLASIRQVKSIQSRMVTYQEQVATGVRFQTFADYGPEASRIQTYRADISSLKIYLQNIDLAQTNIEQMTASLEESTKQAGNVLSAMSIQPEEGSGYDLVAIRSAANAALQVIQTNMNTKIGDRYILAGTDVSNEPYSNPTSATSNIQNEINNWLNGTSTKAAFLSNLDNLSDSALGFSLTVQTSKNVFVRADDNFEVDYTAKANNEGYKKIVTALNALTNIREPATGDIPNREEFYDVMNSLYRTIQSGIEDLRASTVTVSTASQIIDTIKAGHQNEIQANQKTLEATESANTTDALVTFQTLQTQLDASYRITAILSQLSLARILS